MLNEIERPMNIIELDDMMEILTDFFNDLGAKSITVGGICGSPLLKIILDTSTAYTGFNRVLIVDGCPDIIYMKKPSECVSNHIYYKNLFRYVPDESEIFPNDPFSLKRNVPNYQGLVYMNDRYINQYEVVIVNNAHLIPELFLSSIVEYFHGKIVVAVDPFDIDGEVFSNVNTIVRSFNKVPPMIGMARKLWGVETDLINKSAKGGIINGKMRRSSIGVSNNHAYITKDEELIKQTRKRRSINNIHRGQRLLITDKRIMLYDDKDGFTHHLSEGDIIVAGQRSNRNILDPYRIFKSNTWIHMKVREEVNEPFLYMTRRYDLHKTLCVPANIIDINTAKLHRFTSSILVCTDNMNVTTREMYSLIKNSITLMICKIK